MSSWADFLRYLVCRVHDGQKRLRVKNCKFVYAYHVWLVISLITHRTFKCSTECGQQRKAQNHQFGLECQRTFTQLKFSLHTSLSLVSLKVSTRVFKDSKRIDLQSREREIHEWSSLFFYLFSLSFFASLADTFIAAPFSIHLSSSLIHWAIRKFYESVFWAHFTV